VAALPLGIVAATGSVASAHEAPGSPVEVFTDTTSSASVLDSIAHGWWGHEGTVTNGVGTPDNGTGNKTTFLDLNGSDPDFSQFSDPANIRVAFVTTSADGSAEHPSASTGQTVDQIFPWFMDAGLQAGLNGNANANDSVAVVSTGSEFDAWFGAGQPLQGFNNSLQMIDIGPNTVSATPQGKSILNRWPAGSHISLVFYESTGASSNGKPVVKVVGGKAVTAYLPFTTVAKPGDSVRTSAGYVNESFGAVAVSTHTALATSVASPQNSGTSIDLTATVTADTGTDTPVGSVEFFDGASSLGTAAVNGSGVATKSNVVLPVGSHTLKAVYTPTNTVALAFNTSTSPDKPFVINGIATNTAASATPNGDVTHAVDLTATVTPLGVTGNVVFKDGATTIGNDAITAGDNVANLSFTFTTPGSHTVTAFFTPDAGSSNYSASQGSITFSLDPPSGVSTDDQTVTATIPPGTITVTTPYTPANPLDLGTVNLNTALTGYLGSAPFQHINVLDTRSGAQPWTLTAIAGDLGDGAGHFINGQNLGLTNLLPETANVLPNRNNNPGLGTITATDNPVPATPVQAGVVGTAGLGGAQHVVLSSTQGPADAWYSGTLTLFAPTTTTTGVYTGTITFTAS
jgi:hypothetical protein